MMHFELIGSDGLDLLHRISTADIRNLTPGIWIDALFCSPTGKIQSYFKLSKLKPDHLLISLESGKDGWNLNEFKAILDRYTFSENYTLRARPEGLTDLRTPSTAERVLKLIPAIDHEIPGPNLVSPLEIGLKHAVADQKGCYPGQEVIEKMISIGSAPKKLVRLDLMTKTTGELQTKPSDEKNPPKALPLPISLTTVDEENGKALAILRKTEAIIGKVFQDSKSRQWELSKVAGEQ